MKKEKVMYVILPKDAEYRKAYVTEDGRVAIAYAEETANDTVKVSKTVSKALPKPTALIGGTEVYQKDNGTGYWYCRIKGGRDEFMCLYCDDLTEDDVLYDENGKPRNFTTARQNQFKDDALKAVKSKPERGYVWLPVYEPAKDENGNLQYVSREHVLRGGLNDYQWEKLFENYSPENGSNMSSKTTAFLLKVRWLKDGYATVEQLADDSKEIGHYWDNENAKHKFEKTGERQLGGLYGFAGNTYKIVKDSESSSGFSLLGGSFFSHGNFSPLADVVHDDSPHHAKLNGVGLLELTK